MSGTDRRRSRGVVWRHLAAGDRFGRPLAEWAHVTPDFPDGITDTDLRAADPEIQRKTALCWFILNFERYDRTKGGPWFRFAETAGAYGEGPYGMGPYGGGFGTRPFAPVSVDALSALDQEFRGIISHDGIKALGDHLGSDWMPRAQALGLRDDDEAFSRADLQTALSGALDELSIALGPILAQGAYGGIGHNHPPDSVPISDQERQDLLGTVAQVKAEAQSPSSFDAKLASDKWARIRAILERIGLWSIDQAGKFLSRFRDRSADSLGDSMPYLVVCGIIAWEKGIYIAHILDKLLFLL